MYLNDLFKEKPQNINDTDFRYIDRYIENSFYWKFIYFETHEDEFILKYTKAFGVLNLFDWKLV